MAIINCPNCGRKISDSAIRCPGCEFDLRQYFEQQKREKERALEEKRKQEEAKRLEQQKNAPKPKCPECESEVDQTETICPNCGFPLNDPESREKVFTIKRLEQKTPIKKILGTIVAAIFFTVMLVWSWCNSNHGDLGLLIMISFFAAIFSWLWLWVLLSDESKRQKDLELAKRDYEQYKKAKKEEQEALRIYERQQEEKRYRRRNRW